MNVRLKNCKSFFFLRNIFLFKFCIRLCRSGFLKTPNKKKTHTHTPVELIVYNSVDLIAPMLDICFFRTLIYIYIYYPIYHACFYV